MENRVPCDLHAVPSKLMFNVDAIPSRSPLLWDSFLTIFFFGRLVSRLYFNIETVYSLIHLFAHTVIK